MSTRRPGRSGRRVLVFFSLLLALVAAGCGGDTQVTPGSFQGLSSQDRLTRGQEAVRAFVSALNARDEAAYDKAIDPRFAARLTPVLANAEAIGVSRIAAEYVDSLPGSLDADEHEEYGDQAWVASVRLTYRTRIDDATSRHETALVLTPEGDRARVAAIGGHEQRSPLWLTGPVQVAGQGVVSILNAGTGATSRYLRLAQQAVREVRAVLPRWDGRLVIEVPRDKEALDATLAAEPDTYANIAAVTTTADGTLVPGAPVHVYLNPRVFATLKHRGAQVVISHEATHVATQASFASMPLWLLEGFADQVALRAADVPVQQAARQVIARMRKEGLPTGLPTPADLEPTAEGLGATYEEAWLACRFLADTWGEHAMVRFYETVNDGAAIGTAFRTVLGIGEKEFVERWRADLSSLL